jgi:hypothetical protein
MYSRPKVSGGVFHQTSVIAGKWNPGELKSILLQPHLESALLSEVAKESAQKPISDPILAIDETPLSDLDDEVK